MAVRLFDPSVAQRAQLGVVAPPSRRELRRARHRYAMIGALSLAVPFCTALVVLGVSH